MRMNNEIAELLRSVLKEELEPVNNRLDSMDKRLNRMDQRFGSFEQRLHGMDQRLDTIEQEVKALRTDHAELRDEIIGTLGDFTEKIASDVDYKTSALNKRVFNIEAELQRLIGD